MTESVSDFMISLVLNLIVDHFGSIIFFHLNWQDTYNKKKEFE
jgi:hypothetical protein